MLVQIKDSEESDAHQSVRKSTHAPADADADFGPRKTTCSPEILHISDITDVTKADSPLESLTLPEALPCQSPAPEVAVASIHTLADTATITVHCPAIDFWTRYCYIITNPTPIAAIETEGSMAAAFATPTPLPAFASAPSPMQQV